MKKLFLLFAASALVFSAVAQKPMVTSTIKRVLPLAKKSDLNESQGTTTLPMHKPMGSKTITSSLVGTSGNAWSVQYPLENAMAYNEQFNVMSFSHRGGPTNGTLNQVFNNRSIDGGATWDTTNMVYSSALYKGRYPNSAFYNPTGNTNINNLYSVVLGPLFSVTSNAPKGTYITWQKQNGVSKTFEYIYAGPDSTRMETNCLQTCQDGRFYIAGDAHEVNDSSYYINRPHYTILGGTIDAANDTISNLVDTTFTPSTMPFFDATLGFVRYYGTRDESAIAFNKSGTVGYFVTMGIPNPTGPDTNTSWRPIVYKTTNQGHNWVLLPDYDFSQIPSIIEMLPGTADDSTLIVPQFRQLSDVLVDGNDNLHILSIIGAGSTNTTNVDSLGYSWGFTINGQAIEGMLWDTYTTSTGWDAVPISYQYTQDPAEVTDIFTTKARLQGGLTDDGQKIFYTWADSDPANGEFNYLPDLVVACRNIDSANITNKLIITTGTVVENMANLHIMAPQVRQNANDYTVFNVASEIGSTNVQPVKYWFIKDATMTLEVSINDIDKNIANISNLYPNPTNGLTNVDLTLIKTTDVSIQVVNMMGQVVSSQDFGTRTTGMHKLSINATDLTSGIYFVTVKAGNSTSTSKMIVR